jgi:hypothetical protein
MTLKAELRRTVELWATERELAWWQWRYVFHVLDELG